jgi:hypothetical protein
MNIVEPLNEPMFLVERICHQILAEVTQWLDGQLLVVVVSQLQQIDLNHIAKNLNSENYLKLRNTDRSCCCQLSRLIS